jgi:hypothetical protein
MDGMRRRDRELGVERRQKPKGKKEEMRQGKISPKMRSQEGLSRGELLKKQPILFQFKT